MSTPHRHLTLAPTDPVPAAPAAMDDGELHQLYERITAVDEALADRLAASPPPLQEGQFAAGCYAGRIEGFLDALHLLTGEPIEDLRETARNIVASHAMLRDSAESLNPMEEK